MRKSALAGLLHPNSKTNFLLAVLFNTKALIASESRTLRISTLQYQLSAKSYPIITIFSPDN
jgi:hypothetical protein